MAHSVGMVAEARPRGFGSRLLRIGGYVFAALCWVAVAALALHTSRFPVVLHRYSREYFVLLTVVAAGALAVTAAQLPRVRQALYVRRYTLIWILVFCPLFTFGAVEGTMRLFNLFGSSFYSDIRRYMGVLVLDDRLLFRNPANYRGEYHGFEIETNELGLRDRSVRPPAPGRTRILVLGDSVAFGWGVDAGEAFPQQLERDLQTRTNRPVETINAGVPGYNTTQELTFLEMYARQLRPDTVLLAYVDNDIDAIDPARVHMGVFPNPVRDPSGALDYVLSRSRLYFMMRHLIPGFLGTRYGSPSERRQTAGWRDSMTSMERMAAFCRVHELPLVVFHYRMLDDPISHALNDRLEGLARSTGFTFVDTLPWFRGRNVRELTNSFVDSHPNAAGHRVLAQGIAQALVARGLGTHPGEGGHDRDE